MILKTNEDFEKLERPKNIKKAFYEVECFCGKRFVCSYQKLLKPNWNLCSRHKTEKTLEERYGDKHYVGKRDLEKWKNKVKNTMKERYGVENAGQMDGHYDKCLQTMTDNYGSAENAYKELVKRSQNTRVEKYGSLRNSYEKSVETFKNHFGVDNISQTDTWKHTRIKNLNEKYCRMFSNRGQFYEDETGFYFKCASCGHIHKQTNNDMWTRCYECFPVNKNANLSAQQNEVANFIENYASVKQCVKGVFPEKPKLELDIVTDKFAVEFDGAYWHNNKKDVKQDLYAKQGKNLIRIFDFEWEDKCDIVKSLLKSKLGVYDRRIYARQCSCMEISKDAYKSFCENNHMQGYAYASIMYGLFYNEELVQVMSFSKPRYTKDFQYEMIRECSKLGYNIVGGKSKLLRHFEVDYKPKSLISYCDKRLFDGHSYVSLGFEHTKTNPPAFYVYNRGVLLNRMNYTKQKMKLMKDFNYNEELSQIDNIIENNLVILWDNGTKVYVKKY